MTLDLLDPTRRRVARIETAAADALGPDEEIERDGWRFRANGGVARRANSVLPERTGRMPMAAKLAEVEAFYRSRGLSPRIQLSPVASPADLDRRLAQNGWIYEQGALLLARATRAPTQRGSARTTHVDRSERPSTDWILVCDEVSPGRSAWAVRRAERRDDAAQDVTHWVAYDPDGSPVAACVAICDPARHHVGLFEMGTRVRWRRRGYGRALVLAALERAGRTGAERAYLQVSPDNRSALALYRELGFRDHHRYHYRRAPTDEERDAALDDRS